MVARVAAAMAMAVGRTMAVVARVLAGVVVAEVKLKAMAVVARVAEAVAVAVVKVVAVVARAGAVERAVARWWRWWRRQ